MPENHNLSHTPADDGEDSPSNDIQRETYGSNDAAQDMDDAESIPDTIQNIGRQVVDGVKSVASDPKQMVQAVRDLVRDYPLASLATVAFASLAIGRAFRR